MYTAGVWDGCVEVEDATGELYKEVYAAGVLYGKCVLSGGGCMVGGVVVVGEL